MGKKTLFYFLISFLLVFVGMASNGEIQAASKKQVLPPTSLSGQAPEDIGGIDPGEKNDKQVWIQLIHNSGTSTHPLFCIQSLIGEGDERTLEYIKFVLIQSGIEQSDENINLLNNLAHTMAKYWVCIGGVDRNPTYYEPFIKTYQKELDDMTERFFKKFNRKERVRLYCVIEWFSLAEGALKKAVAVRQKEKIGLSDVNSRTIDLLNKRFPNNNQQVIKDFLDTVSYVRPIPYPKGHPNRHETDKYVMEKKKERSEFLRNLKTFDHFKALKTEK